MTSKSLIARSIAAIALTAALATFVHAALYAPEAEVDPGSLSSVKESQSSTNTTNKTKTQVATAPKPRPPDDPGRLEIPSLNVNANVQYAGLSYKGNIGIPTNFTDVAWFREGGVPGKVGTAIMDGHVDNGLGLPGVFKHLDQIHQGDEVDVVQNNGIVLHFTVTNVKEYSYTDTYIPELFSSDDGQAHLNLITCAGDWIQSAKSYNERLVVYTTLEQ